MKKKFMLPCIAAVAIATFVSTKTIKSNASEGNDLLMENVEALSLTGDNGGGTGYKGPSTKYDCPFPFTGDGFYCASTNNIDCTPMPC